MNESPQAEESPGAVGDRFYLPNRVSTVMGQPVPADARPLGYAALAAAYDLEVPAPDRLFATGERHTLRTEDRWSVLTPRYRPPDTLVSHLAFALRHEPVDMGLLAALFRRPVAGASIAAWVRQQPTGKHARRAWICPPPQRSPRRMRSIRGVSLSCRATSSRATESAITFPEPRFSVPWFACRRI